MNFVFKIFGAPYTFDIYGSNREDTNYFQLYDDGSNEEVKLTVHRKANGEVCYSYLRYNMISSSGRTGAFFGMAVVFHNEYCRDVENLYKLFDAVYQNILETGILLQKIENSGHQAKYLIAHFSDAPAEVTRIENIIYNNLQKNYSQDILPINSSFSINSKELIMLPMNKEANVSLLTELRKRAWISFSPIYNSQVILSREYINTLKTNTRIIRDKELSEITNLLVRINLLPEDKKKEKLPKDILLQITNWRDSLKETQKTINDYINIQPEPGRSQLEKINNEIIPILESCETNYTVVKNIIDKPKSEASKQPEPPKPEPPKPETPKPTPNPLKKGSYSLEVKVKDEKGGVITGSRSGTYPVGSSIELKAVPSPGYRFVSWTEGEKVVCQTTTYSFQMYDRPMQLIAHFEAEQDSAWDLLWIRMVHFGAAIPKKVLLAIATVIVLILLLIFFYPKEKKDNTEKTAENTGITAENTGITAENTEKTASENSLSDLQECINKLDSLFIDIKNKNSIADIDDLIKKANNSNCNKELVNSHISEAKKRAEKILENELNELYDTDKKIERIKSYDAVKKKIDDYKSALDFIDFNAYKETYRSTTIKFYENEIKVGKWKNKDKDKFANYIKENLEDPNNEIAKNVKKYYTDQCIVSYNKQTWTVENLLEQLKNDLKKKENTPYDFVINGCNTIIKSKCATEEQKEKAKELQEEAKEAKKNVNTDNFKSPSQILAK